MTVLHKSFSRYLWLLVIAIVGFVGYSIFWKNNYKITIENKASYPVRFYILNPKEFTTTLEFDTTILVLNESKCEIVSKNRIWDSRFYIGQPTENGYLIVPDNIRSKNLEFTIGVVKVDGKFHLNCTYSDDEHKKIVLTNQFLTNHVVEPRWRK